MSEPTVTPRTYKRLVTQLKKDLIDYTNNYAPNPCLDDEENYCLLLEQLHYHIGKTLYRIRSERAIRAFRAYIYNTSEPSSQTSDISREKS